ncbi:hypothetical protein RND81_10G029600 [Saponaria officinalis]|uniref:Reverse transcriptase zinc-binding domain-containing protein n=1 Tax=Saponaria officinalis TaxID=3572 RepID=A0AAW1HXZ3_SAPOF
MIFKSWSSVCLPWSEVGFDIREILAWNKALLARLLWMLDTGHDSVWLRWVRYYYMSERSIWDVRLSMSFSESFRSILLVRDLAISILGNVQAVQNWFRGCLIKGKFSIAWAYDLFRPRAERVPWALVLRNQSVVPSHAFITILAAQQKLPTVDSLRHRGLHLVNRCCLCKLNGESHRHLFFKCPYSKQVWISLTGWMRLSNRSCDLINELNWMSKRGYKAHWKTHWFRACVAAAVYFIWIERNARIFKSRERNPLQLARSIKYVVAIRCVAFSSLSHMRLLIDALNS